MLIRQVLLLTKWEWYKIRRLRMPWILLAIAVLVSQLGIWVDYAAYHNDTVQEVFSGGSTTVGTTYELDGRAVSLEVSCEDIVNDRMPPEIDQLPEEQRRDFLEKVEEVFGGGTCDNYMAADEFRKGFTLPDSITGSITRFASLGPIAIGPLLIMILAASLLGAEYGWGTLRTVLAGGVGRGRFLSAKLLLLLRLCSDALVVISVIAVVSRPRRRLHSPGRGGGTCRLREVVRRGHYLFQGPVRVLAVHCAQRPGYGAYVLPGRRHSPGNWVFRGRVRYRAASPTQ